MSKTNTFFEIYAKFRYILIYVTLCIACAFSAVIPAVEVAEAAIAAIWCDFDGNFVEFIIDYPHIAREKC